MKFKSLVFATMGLFLTTAVIAQESEKIDTLDMLNQHVTALEDGFQISKKLKISGYVQAQWQSSQIDVNGKGSNDLKVGGPINAGEALGSDYNRFGIRRGRLKATFTDTNLQGIVYIDANERGVTLREANMTITDPVVGVVSLKGGIYYRPFGGELEYASSSSRESAERSRVIQNLFPDERDLGATLILQAPKTSPWSALKLEAGLFAGNAIGIDTKSKKDLISHLTYTKTYDNFRIGLGTSLYNGYIFQPTKHVYVMENNAFVATGDSASNTYHYAKRQYFGFDGQFALKSVVGLTVLRAEYIFGTQPGSDASSSSPVLTVKPYAAKESLPTVTGDTYMRSTAGGYILLAQDIADTKHTVVAKFDWYDPNTKISGNSIGVAGATGSKKTNKTDIAYSTIGLGYIYRMNNAVRLMAYYDFVSNETSSALVQTYDTTTTPGKSISKGTNYTSHLAANLLTIRMQYKF